MQKGVAGTIAFQMNLKNGDPATDVDLTPNPTVSIVKDNGASASGTGAIAHKAKGLWTYAYSAAESNADHVAIQMDHGDAITQTLNVYPSTITAEVAKIIKTGEETTWASSLGTKNDVVVTRN